MDIENTLRNDLAFKSARSLTAKASRKNVLKSYLEDLCSSLKSQDSIPFLNIDHVILMDCVIRNDKDGIGEVIMSDDFIERTEINKNNYFSQVRLLNGIKYTAMSTRTKKMLPDLIIKALGFESREALADFLEEDRYPAVSSAIDDMCQQVEADKPPTIMENCRMEIDRMKRRQEQHIEKMYRRRVACKRFLCVASALLLGYALHTFTVGADDSPSQGAEQIMPQPLGEAMDKELSQFSPD